MAKSSNITNFHMQYLDVTSQHWDRNSEGFAGGDNLLTALENGWVVQKCELVRHWYAGMRSVKIYEFELTKGERNVTMPVIDNPYVERLVQEEGIDVLVSDENKIQ